MLSGHSNRREAFWVLCFENILRTLGYPNSERKTFLLLLGRGKGPLLSGEMWSWRAAPSPEKAGRHPPAHTSSLTLTASGHPLWPPCPGAIPGFPSDTWGLSRPHICHPQSRIQLDPLHRHCGTGDGPTQVQALKTAQG